MTLHLLHFAVMYLLPLVCGLAAGIVVGRSLQRPVFHLAACLATLLIAVVTQYFAMLLALGVATGSWPDALPFGGVVYQIAWFGLFAGFTTGPLVLGGYLAPRWLGSALPCFSGGESDRG